MARLHFAPLPMAEWAAIDAAASAPTFYARPAWARAVAAVSPRFEPWPLVCEVRGVGRVLVPLMRTRGRRLPWTILQGVPMWGYTAVQRCDGGALDAATRSAVVEGVLWQGDSVRLNLWPFEEVSVRGATVREPAETSALDMQGGVEAALARMNPKARRMAGQAKRRGATCSLENREDAIDAYYALLSAAAVERWKRPQPAIPKEFLRAVWREGGDSVELWFVRYEGEPVAGGVALYGRAEVSLWTTATKPGMEILRPHNLLHATILEHAARRGLRWYNLDASSGLEGVLRFKHALGAQQTFYEILGREGRAFRLVRGVRRLLGMRG
jgi:hypothetical protein